MLSWRMKQQSEGKGFHKRLEEKFGSVLHANRSTVQASRYLQIIIMPTRSNS